MTTGIKKKGYIDPVCQMTVGVHGSILAYTLGACTYHFCSEGCRKAFVANPDKYLAIKPAKRKGWWGRYLDRLNKATGGQAQSCH